jgi:hypothetical protein
MLGCCLKLQIIRNLDRLSLPGNPMFLRRKYIVAHIGSRVAGAKLCHNVHEASCSVLVLPESRNAVRSIGNDIEGARLDCDTPDKTLAKERVVGIEALPEIGTNPKPDLILP